MTKPSVGGLYSNSPVHHLDHEGLLNVLVVIL